jgi:PKD repeat protein
MSDIGPTATHAYAAVGTYSVTLTVTDDLGVVGTQTRDLNVVNNVWTPGSVLEGVVR